MEGRRPLNEMHLWALSKKGRDMFIALVNAHSFDPDLAFELTEIELGDEAYEINKEDKDD